MAFEEQPRQVKPGESIRGRADQPFINSSPLAAGVSTIGSRGFLRVTATTRPPWAAAAHGV